jgi:hypothetical protein
MYLFSAKDPAHHGSTPYEGSRFFRKHPVPESDRAHVDAIPTTAGGETYANGSLHRR